MLHIITLLLALPTLVWSAMVPMCTPAGVTSTPSCVLTFKNIQAPQREPVSTVYSGIVTTTFFIVDCNICTVKNIDANPVPSGRFTTKVTSSLLRITKIACMPEETAITRREYRGQPAKEIRAPPVADSHLDGKRSIQEISDMLAQRVDPDNSQLSFAAYTIIKQLHSAVFALDLINSGFNLTSLCQDLRQPLMQLRMIAADLNPQQVADIVCFASIYGIDLRTTNTQLLSDLAAAIYAVQVGSQFTTELNRLCSSLDLSAGPALGFDAPGIRKIICSPTNSTTTVSPNSTTSSVSGGPVITVGPPLTNGGNNETTATTSINNTTSTMTSNSGDSSITVGPPLSTGVTLTTGTGGSIGTIGTVGTGDMGIYTNTTTPPGTISSSNTVSGINETTAMTSGGDRLPPNPTASPYYPLWTTSIYTTAVETS